MEQEQAQLCTVTRKPEFITFTGVDQQTDLERVQALSARYPIEWGVLFSPSRGGIENRYPGSGTVRKIINTIGHLPLAAHLCGGAAKRVLLGLDSDGMLREVAGFKRIQVNYVPNPKFWPELKQLRGIAIGQYEAELFGAQAGRPVIVQHRSASQWPTIKQAGLTFLFDQSGGRGIQATTWPAHPDGKTLVGYAGGIGPDNVAQVVQQIDSSGPYYLDMEGRVRCPQDWLCLDKVQQVCETVYGK